MHPDRMRSRFDYHRLIVAFHTSLLGFTLFNGMQGKSQAGNSTDTSHCFVTKTKADDSFQIVEGAYFTSSWRVKASARLYLPIPQPLLRMRINLSPARSISISIQIAHNSSCFLPLPSLQMPAVRPLLQQRSGWQVVAVTPG